MRFQVKIARPWRSRRAAVWIQIGVRVSKLCLLTARDIGKPLTEDLSTATPNVISLLAAPFLLIEKRRVRRTRIALEL
jgi:hypothetical protein